ncbi:16S rRNA (guanine(966)-N(2))-methyltransferase RsmD [Camelliibacillus cellulosilyticus]|uniref:16S rRNA (Guanine(966)-N(2))-methyltransferase RsmD n=1 Tax=Camelliibacillus cellulosilyticus TaxID=2174486 RepID=A0ABV9GJH0_9BACL
MRVISGSCKGRPLKPVPGNQTRPTTDKVKETIFNIIGPYFQGGQALDLYGGSGALGIEALSRGMEKAIFIDRSALALQTIRQNLSICGLIASAAVYRNDAHRALRLLKKKNESFDLIFLDPPYKEARLRRDLGAIAKLEILNPHGLIVTEHDAELNLPERLTETIERWKHQTYQSHTAVTIYLNRGGAI